MESSLRDYFIDIAVDIVLPSKLDQIMLFPCFTFIPKTGTGIPKTAGVSFYCGVIGYVRVCDNTRE